MVGMEVPLGTAASWGRECSEIIPPRCLADMGEASGSLDPVADDPVPEHWLYQGSVDLRHALIYITFGPFRAGSLVSARPT